jgi:hypothetical protein
MSKAKDRTKEVTACNHRFERFSGNALYWEPPADCRYLVAYEEANGFGPQTVAFDTPYHVYSCTKCGFRQDRDDDGWVIREYDKPRFDGTNAGPPVDIYEPKFDGIDPFTNEEALTREPFISTLFDSEVYKWAMH